MIPLVPIVVVAAVATVAYLASDHGRPDRPDYQPDEPMPPALPGTAPSSTGYKNVDKILDDLKKASESSRIPLGLLVGWVAKESNGRLAVHPQPGPGDTKLDERGYFQLTPAESKAIGFDHKRLSTDSIYSINAGLAIIGKYMGVVERLGVAPNGTSYFWKMVKLTHSMGSGQTSKIVGKAKAEGKATSWDVLETYATNLPIGGSQPKKWMPFVDAVAKIGAPFGGFVDGQTVVGFGEPEIPYPDIPDPLDVIAPRTDSPAVM